MTERTGQAGPRRDTAADFQTLPLPALQAALAASPAGLSEREAQRRLTQNGPNELPHERDHAVLRFLGYLWGPIPWMLEVALILSILVGHWLDSDIIFVLLVATD